MAFKMDRRVGRATDRGVENDGVLERLAGHHVGRLQILVHHIDDALAGPIGHLPALAVGRWNGCRTGQLHAEPFGQRVHRRRRAHGVAIADRGSRGGDQIDEALVVDLALRQLLPRLPHHGTRAGALAAVEAVQHWPDRQRDRRQIDGRRRHQTGRRRLIATDHQHDAVERITEQHFGERQVGEVAVERGGRPLAGLLDRMHREFEADATGRDDAVAHPLGEFDMVTVAGGEVGAGLGDADDRLAAGQLVEGHAVVEVALEIKRRHVRVVRVVEPGAGPEFAVRRGHGTSPLMNKSRRGVRPSRRRR